RVAQVHVDVVDVVVGAVDDDVVAGGALELRGLDGAAAGRDELRAAVRHDVLALVRVTGAAGAEAVAVGVLRAQRELVEVQVERVALRIRHPGAAGDLAGGVGDDGGEAVARLGRGLAAHEAVPLDGLDGAGRDAGGGPVLDDGAVGLAGEGDDRV